jgi:plasmid stability protein
MNVNYEIPDDLHKALKLRAVEKEMSLKDLIIELLTKALESDKVSA